ncbi:prolipoprotein diacylglyceryl transferase [Algirhabdus cladophorae]|uniref:prolipoprotein diacylglyceryl transferase n=1 Tax=Algirhabdus cladophorae TaxID=3377108 RepID=UPI003B848094
MLAAIPFPQISPEIFSIDLFGFELALRWYALSYIVGILIGWRIVVTAVKRPVLWRESTAPMTPQLVEDLLTWVIFGVIIGGRLGFVAFYQPSYYAANPQDIPKVWQGGMAFHGGFAGVVAVAIYFCRRHKIPMLSLADCLAIATAPALFLGRVANFIKPELWGRQTDMPWGVVFPVAEAQDCGPLIEICARHPSQLYEAVLEGLILGAILLYLAFRRGAFKRPGLLTGVFFAGYGAARFLVEFFRQPDAQFISPGNPLGLALHLDGYGLTMGQLLSIPMILIGLWLVARSQRP